MTTSLPNADAQRVSDLVCLTHLRWNWVYQRPQHLMTLAARDRRVFVFEEPIESDAPPRLTVQRPQHNLLVATPGIPAGLTAPQRNTVLRELLDDWLEREHVRDFTLWYYTPMALHFAAHLEPSVIVYDCMDELSAFAGAPPELRLLERQLFARCDIVFTGGTSLYEAKRRHHSHVHAMPSSVDVKHFGQARSCKRRPEDQDWIPRPRLGYCGVIDERLDLELVAGVAAARPDWHLVFVGPVTKIDPASLPTASNIHYLGARSYQELPCYLAGWDVALLPFAHNESTRFISPTKTPEYLAAGLPVVSSSICDVVRTFERTGLVEIADGAEQFVVAIEKCLADRDPTRRQRIDEFLARESWERTWTRMQVLMSRAMSQQSRRHDQRGESAVGAAVGTTASSGEMKDAS
jgi:glycosyltransferase involved in cell wall biosynthesis